MDIKQEDFDKLKQLDRIEYRQKEDRLEKKYEDLHFPYGDIALIFMGIIGFLILLSWRLESYMISLETIISLMKATIIITVLGILFNLTNSLFKVKAIKKLNSEYFKVEVNKK